MQAIGSTGTTSISPQARELIRTILDAATALKRLLPDEELEHGFEFHWGHHLLKLNSSILLSHALFHLWRITHRHVDNFAPQRYHRNGSTIRTSSVL